MLYTWIVTATKIQCSQFPCMKRSVLPTIDIRLTICPMACYLLNCPGYIVSTQGAIQGHCWMLKWTLGFSEVATWLVLVTGCDWDNGNSLQVPCHIWMVRDGHWSPREVSRLLRVGWKVGMNSGLGSFRYVRTNIGGGVAYITNNETGNGQRIVGFQMHLGAVIFYEKRRNMSWIAELGLGINSEVFLWCDGREN